MLNNWTTLLLLNLISFSYACKIETSSFELSFHIFAWRRSLSLQRLLLSLSSAHDVLDPLCFDNIPFDGQGNLCKKDERKSCSIPLIFHVDGEPSPKVTNVIHAFSWPYGSKTVHVAAHHLGLKNAILNSWKPRGDEYALLLEDDLMLSPYFMHWVRLCINYYLKHDTKMGLPPPMGCSLYSPRVDEMTDAKGDAYPLPFSLDSILWPNIFKKPRFSTNGNGKAYNMIDSDKNETFTHLGEAVLFQVPCSWGAVYSGRQWSMFLDYTKKRTFYTNVTWPPLPSNIRANQWHHSWKRFLAEFMLAKAYTLVYPALPNQQSFSTNYVETGVHSIIWKDENTSPLQIPMPDVLRNDIDERFTVPLVQELSPLLALTKFTERLISYKDSMTLINMHHQVCKIEDLLREQQNYKKDQERQLN